MGRRKITFRQALVATFVMMAGLVLLASCGGGGGSSATTGTLKLGITDAQRDDFSSVVIAIKEIRVVPAGREGAADDDPSLPLLKRFDTPESIDVLQWQFVQKPLGEVVLPAGSYSQIRLILEPNPAGQRPPLNYVTLKTAPTVPIAIKTPSGSQSGLKINGPIEITPGVINAMVIDFDPNTAIVPTGKGGPTEFNFKPHGIRLVKMAEALTQFGSISGTVFSPFSPWSSATVYVKRRGAVEDSDPIAAGRIFASYTSNRWEAPFAAFVPPTTAGVGYKTFIAANGFRLYSSQSVPVAQGASTSLDEIPLVPLP